MIWIVFALMTAATVFALVWPLATRRSPRSGASADLAFYADQLQEVEGDLARGLVGTGEADVARAEIGRRLLASARSIPALPQGQTGPAPGRRLAAVGAAVVLVPALSLALYLRIGHPGQPDAPLAARVAAPPADFAASIARIEAHLRDHPEDGRGFEVIAPVYLRMGRVDDAVAAYGAAIRALGDSAPREAALGRAIAVGADGVVTAAARAAFDKALALDPALPEARFFVALAAEQDGDKGRAETLWRDLLAHASADAPWREAAAQHLAAVTGQPGAASPAGGPGSPAGAAIAALPADAQSKMIRGMVDGLANRLAENGRDPDGWLRLIKAYTVLGEGEKARAALADARRGLAGDTASLARIEAEAQELGLGG